MLQDDINKWSNEARLRLLEEARKKLKNNSTKKSIWKGYDSSGRPITSSDGVQQGRRGFVGKTPPLNSIVYEDETSIVTAKPLGRKNDKRQIIKPNLKKTRPNYKKVIPLLLDASPFSIEWEFEQSGITMPQSYGWRRTENEGYTYDIIFRAENSYNCQGSNNRRQYGTMTATIKTSREVTFDFTVTGRVETQNSGYDEFRIYAGGANNYAASYTIHYSAMSYGENGGCDMRSPPNVITNLEHGTLYPKAQLGGYDYNRILFTFDTVDAAYHVDCYYQVTLTINV